MLCKTFFSMMYKKNTDIKIRIHIIYNIFLLNKMIKKNLIILIEILFFKDPICE